MRETLEKLQCVVLDWAVVPLSEHSNVLLPVILFLLALLMNSFHYSYLSLLAVLLFSL